MKILHLTDEVWDSGLTAYALQISEQLLKAGHDVKVGVRPGKKPEEMAKAQGIPTVAVQNFFDLMRLLQTEPWDVVNSHTGRTHTWTVFSYLLREPHPCAAIVRTRGDARPLRVNFLSRFIYQHTHGVVALSEHIRRQYERGFYLGEERLRTIYPTVEVEAAITAPPKNTVGVLGRLDPVKGHTVFLDAAARVLKEVPDARFLIAGSEANVSADILMNQARELKIDRSVNVVGFQPSASDFMKGCSAGVIASIGSEEVSRACLEWMAAGRPVVGTLVGCLPELIETDETGFLVPPGDSAAMGEAIIKLLKDQALSSRLGKMAHEIIQKKFNGKIQLEKTLDLYSNALQRARAGRA